MTPKVGDTAQTRPTQRELEQLQRKLSTRPPKAQRKARP